MNPAIFSRIKNLIILALAGVRFIFKGKANKKVVPKKILIVQMAKIGDMVCSTPMFRAIKEKYPTSNLCVMGDAINKELLFGNSDVDNYIVCKKGFGFNDFLRPVKKGKFDFACVTAPNFTALAALYIAGIPLIVAPVIKNGSSPYESRPYKILKNFVVVIPHFMSNYAPREYLRLLEPIGIFTENTKKYLYFSFQAEQKVQNFFTSQKINGQNFIVGIAPSAGNKIKRWGRDKFAKIADYLYEKYGATVVIIGGASDKSEVDEMISYLNPKTKVFNTAGIFNIEELKAFVSKINLFISVDTGAIYIAEAFNISTVDIVGPIDEKEQPPIGKFHRIVVAQRQKPELYVMNARVYDEKEAKKQVDGITVEMVIKELDDLIKSIYSKNNL